MANIDRFIRYAKIFTDADAESHITPSNPNEKELGELLVKELLELGVKDAHMDEWGNVYGHIPGEGYTIGLNAHMDTALEVSGKNVKPRIISNYDGKDIKLNDQYTLSPASFSKLNECVGKDLVVTDGTTLLGADDKAGIGIIMSIVEYFYLHPEIKHHPIAVCFTVDEEIGEGPDHFDVKKMNAEFAYTFDGSFVDVVNYKNFDAQELKISVKGVAIHPGEGKGKLVNALGVLNQLLGYLNPKDTPYEANMDEGYWHIEWINGTSEYCETKMILRDFSKQGLAKRYAQVEKGRNELLKYYPTAEIKLELRDQYENMESYVKKDPRPVDLIDRVLKDHGYTPRYLAIRGGTDGATFSKMGLVTPNLGTGSYNHHGRYEFLVIQEYEELIQIGIDLLK